MRVVVGMSGGVDSSVAALLLLEKGYDVVGVHMHLFDAKKGTRTCCSVEDAYNARDVAISLGIPFYVWNFEDIFRERVIDPFIKDYISGKTPNPCIACNEEIKFQGLLERAEKIGADAIATGHYADIREIEGSRLLKRPKDRDKDQTYFLYRVSSDVLARTIFPLATLTKSEIRNKAVLARLPVSDKRESQEVCFVDGQPLELFFKQFGVEDRIGEIVDEKGNIVGWHKGTHVFTIGQRRGFGKGFGAPRYVIDIRYEQNQVVIGPKDLAMFKGARLDRCIWKLPQSGMTVKAEVMVRYKSRGHMGVVKRIGESEAEVMFEDQVFAVTPGQSAVFYRDDLVIGGGVIKYGIR